MAKKHDFLKLIEEQRNIKKEEKFNGTFLEYLNVVKNNPEICDLAHKRLVKSIENVGISSLDPETGRQRKIFDNDDVKVYDYFKDSFFGNERTIYKIMRFLNLN